MSVSLLVAVNVLPDGREGVTLVEALRLRTTAH